MVSIPSQMPECWLKLKHFTNLYSQVTVTPFPCYTTNRMIKSESETFFYWPPILWVHYIFKKDQFVTLPLWNMNTSSCRYFKAISQLQLSNYLDSRVNCKSGLKEGPLHTCLSMLPPLLSITITDSWMILLLLDFKMAAQQ